MEANERMNIPLSALRCGCLQQCRRWSVAITDGLLDELIQESWLYVCQYAQSRSFVDERDFWKFCANYAQYATRKYLVAQWRHWHQEMDALQLATQSQPSPNGLAPEIAQRLLCDFLAQRQKKGSRGRHAAEQDVRILDLILTGYSNDGIAIETGLSVKSVKTYRKRIRKRLEVLSNL